MITVLSLNVSRQVPVVFPALTLAPTLGFNIQLRPEAVKIRCPPCHVRLAHKMKQTWPEKKL
jgi:hypothetical protein